ncbi:MAG: RNA-binding transcriptional accessory protein [Clostridia bacterium]|nr:RNA-binding transcriptional accessory protein [Clostridia bacterium]
MNINEKLAAEFRIRLSQVEATVNLIDDGNTIPFISRYRKEATGGLTDDVLRDLDERLNYLRNLETRKEEVIKLIDEQGKLTDDLKEEILKAEVLQRVEDLYKPFKQKKATRASKAKERGLEPLAKIFWEQESKEDPMVLAKDFVNEEVENEEAAIQGAMDIIAEQIADDPEYIKEIRRLTEEHGVVTSEAVDKENSTVYDMYYEFAEGIKKIANHRVLAINRGEKEKALKVKIEAPVDDIISYIESQLIKDRKGAFVEILKNTVADSYKRLIAPSVEREMRNMLTEKAEEDAIKVFAKNTKNLLMVPPVKGKRIIAIDPGFRTGCKVAILNEYGKLLAYTTIYPTEPKNDVEGTERVLAKAIEKFKINVIVIGNGTASRETEEVVSNFLKKNNLDIQYTIVNEAGASVYSASKLASEEYPDLDVTTRGAMSLGRRLQDPLAELVKISPKSIGVGQYQHDINQKALDEALANVVEDTVNSVGVDLNTASPSLLSYISGVNMNIAKNIVAYREEAGKFNNRKELLKVAKLGPKAYEQCAGFMRIADGDNPLDGTSVHPESYEACEAMLAKLGIDKAEISNGGAKDIENRIKLTYGVKKLGDGIKKMAAELGVGEMTLEDIVKEMEKPARDPRDDAPAVVFRNDVRSFDDLKIDMEMTGTVRNVVDFGAFVDIGVKNDGLVHISQLSDKYIKHPMEVVAVGDTVKVKIISIDRDKMRVGLTMKGL